MMSEKGRTLRVLTASAAVAALGHGAAHAEAPANGARQTQTQTQTEDSDNGVIVVTATRRAQSLQAAPLSITAISGEQLERRAATNFFDYGTSVPNLAFGETAEGTTRSRTISIRGISDAGTTGFYIDDTPLPESLDPRVVDISRIEVLRGPQGTLYGARSMGGTVRLVTVQPSSTQAEGRIHGTISTTRNTDRPNYGFDGAVNIPLARDVAGLRLTAYHDYEAGFFKRTFTSPSSGQVSNVARVKTVGASASLAITPTTNLTLTPRVLYQRSDSNGFPFSQVAVPLGAVRAVLRPHSLTQRQVFDLKEGSKDRWVLASFDINYRSPIGLFTSSSSYFHRRNSDVENDTDFIALVFGIKPIPATIQLSGGDSNYTQELRYVSSFPGPLRLTTGLFFQRSLYLRSFPSNYITGLNSATGGVFGTDLLYASNIRIRGTEYAGYAEASYDIAKRLTATVGARIFKLSRTQRSSSDGIAAGGPSVFGPRSQDEHGVTPKFQLQYRFNRENQIYVTAAKGFRPGGVNGNLPTALGCAADLAKLGLTPADTATFSADTVWSYEVGAKATSRDHRLIADASAFQIDWSKIQQSVILPCGFGFRGNAGAARSRGAELEVQARPATGLNLSFGLGYLDARFTQSAPNTQFGKGDRVPQVPKWTINSALDYSTRLGRRTQLFLHANHRYVTSSTSIVNAPVNPVTHHFVPRIRPAYHIVDLRGGIGWGRFELAAFVKNLTDTRTNLSDVLAEAAQVPGQANVFVNQPRTVGVEFRARF